jgi:nickel-dependent lactate racemase
MIGIGYTQEVMKEDEVRGIVSRALEQSQLDGKRVLVIIPDSTRTAPLPMMFRLFGEVLGKRAAALDYLVALGTHQPMSDEALDKLVGITAAERATTYASVRILNHQWNRPDALRTIGTIPRAEIEQLSGGRLSVDLPVTINRAIFDYDQLIVCGPVFPHEVVGFSGGTKYFFPGIAGSIAGPDVINVTHWLGALITSSQVIGVQDTPIRKLIDRATGLIDVPKLFCNMVVTHEGLAGLYIGSYEQAWPKAVALSAQLHVRYVDSSFKRVLAMMPEMYDDMWTAAKGMYKLEPAVADGGEVVIYAPHITEISYTHGKLLDQIGYHVRDYFVKQWERFKDYPWGVLAHSTHLRGAGTYDAQTGLERPRVQVTLATGIPRERCERLNLGYLDPATIDPSQWDEREDEGILVVRNAGETLYRTSQQMPTFGRGKSARGR